MKEGFLFPEAKALPESIQELPQFNGIKYEHKYAHAVMTEILKFMSSSGRQVLVKGGATPSVRNLDAHQMAADQRELNRLEGCHARPVELQNQRQPVSLDKLRVGSINDVKDWGWDGVRFVDELTRIDYQAIESLDIESVGDTQQWEPIFMQHPDTWRMLLSGDDTIIGYWLFAPLFDEDFKKSEEGTLMDNTITLDRIRFFELPGVYKIYICQVCLLPLYRSTSSIRLLLGSLIDVVEKLSMSDVFISHISANAYTLAGHALCKTFNMSSGCKHMHSGVIYSGTIADILGSPLGLRRKELREIYRQQGLL